MKNEKTIRLQVLLRTFYLSQPVKAPKKSLKAWFYTHRFETSRLRYSKFVSTFSFFYFFRGGGQTVKKKQD